MTRILVTLICVIAAARVVAAQDALRPEDVLGQDREITLKEAVALALENNLGLQVFRNEPALARERVREATGAYDPNLNGGFLQTHVETPVASALQNFIAGPGNNGTVDDSKNYGTSLNGILPYGFSYSSGYTFNELVSSSGLNALKPEYTASWISSFTIPLLRDLYWDTPDYTVRRSRVDQQISDEDFRAQLIDVVFLVESSYWALSATRALEAATQKGVDTANDLLEQTKVQYQVGTVSKVLVTQAEAGVAQRESEHIQALNDAKRAQDTLLTAILAPNIGDYATTTVRTEEPTFVDYPVDPSTAVEKARANRPELAAAEKTVEEAEITEKWAWNQKLPIFDVGASYSMNGISGIQKFAPGPLNTTFQDDPTTPGFDSIPTPQPNFGFGRTPAAANSSFFDGHGFHGWSFNANFSYPLGNDTADSRYVQRKIELRRAKTSLARTEQDLVLSVRTAVRELQSSIEAVKAAQRARAASEETLRAEQEKLRLGDSTPHNVLLFQTDLLTAEGNEIRALQTYRTAIAALERAQGTLLESRGISVGEERERGMDQF